MKAVSFAHFTNLSLSMPSDSSQPAEETAMPSGSANSPANSSSSTNPSHPTNSVVHESELKYQRLIEGIGGDYVIYTHDPDGVITYVSPSIEPVLGFPEKSILGLNWRDLIGEHFVGRELADRVAEEVAAGKDFYTFTVEISHADGSTRLVEIQQRPLFDSDGQYLSMEGIAKDITAVTRNANELQKLKHDLEQRVAERTAELIRANDRLRKSEALYRTVVDSQTEFVVRWVPEATFTFVNEAFCRLAGKSSNELVGNTFLPMVHPDDQQAFQEAVSKLSLENSFADFENRLLLPDGSIRWTHWTNRKLFDEQGNFLEYQSVGRDITELREAEDSIREKEAHLTHMSRLATMGELVAGIAHEIHQPLHAAKTFSEAARRNLEVALENEQIQTKNIETAIDCTNEISNAISRTAKIIRRLREFTRPNVTNFEDLPLNRIAQEAGELLAFQSRKARIKIAFEFADDVPPIQGDRVQLEQVCINLLMNAFDALADQPPEVRQVSVRSDFDSQHVRLSFCDNGPGVAIEDMDKIFDTFYSTKPNGMGMGLALCKSIAEFHGGKIEGRRNEGSGMTFVLELPRLRRTDRMGINA